MLAKAIYPVYMNVDRLPSLRGRRVMTRLRSLLLKGFVVSLLLNTGIARAADQHSHMTSKDNALHGKTDLSRHAKRQASTGGTTSRRLALTRRPRIVVTRHDTANFVRNMANGVPAGKTDKIAAEISSARNRERIEPAANATENTDVLARGVASWYSQDRYNKLTASGDRFDENAMTAAHSWLPLGTRVRVTVEGTNESVVVTINDRLGMRSRVIDLSKGAARQLGILSRGLARVTLTRS